MRWLVFIVALSFTLLSCVEQDDLCPKIWTLDKTEISSYARIDSSGLMLETRNANAVNSIVLSQTELVGDFEVTIDLLGLEWDSLASPQFRLEVFDVADSEFPLSGVALNNEAIYCYVGSSPDSRDMRIVNQFAGLLKIKRTQGQIECIGTFGDVSLTYGAEIPEQDVSVRLVLGSASASVGRAAARIAYFEVDYGTQVSERQSVVSDYFTCETW